MNWIQSGDNGTELFQGVLDQNRDAFLLCGPLRPSGHITQVLFTNCKGSDGITQFQRLEALAEADKGVLTTSTVVREGIPKSTLAKFVQKNQYERMSHGVYLSPDAWLDTQYLLQLRCPQIIFSHYNALYFHDLTLMEPLCPTVTVKTGYNPTKLSSQGVKVFTVKAELYEIGLTTGTTNFGHVVRTYDMERTICDIVRNRHVMDQQIFFDALKFYARSGEKKLHHLVVYAKQFHLENLIRRYMEVLL